MDEGGDILGVGLPVDDELGLTDLFADARAVHVDSDDRPIGALNELDESRRGEDLALAVAAEVVLVDGDRVGAVLLACLRFGESDRADLGLGVGHAGDVDVGDRARCEAADFLSDEDALLEAAVGELQAGRDVADGVDARDVGAQALVDEHPAALHGDAGLLEAESLGLRAAAHGDEKDVAVECLAVLECDVDARVVLGR